MTSLRQAVEEYLAMRRALGFKLRLAGAGLDEFVCFAEQQGMDHITADLALRWACLPTGAQPPQWANRLSWVRCFARYCSATDPRTQIPAQELLPHRYPRRAPHIYRDEEIGQLLQAARELPSKTGLRPATYETYLGLLVVTGMRMNEAIHLDRGDVDLSRDILHIRRTKFGKSRDVPIHPSTHEALSRYRHLRDRTYPCPQTAAFLLSEQGNRLGEFSVRATFVKLSHQIGLRSPGDRRGPRLHDFRHRFAVTTLLGWYRHGIDVEQNLPKLATYLGHVHINDTYWYLTAVPELLQWASRRLEEIQEGPVS